MPPATELFSKQIFLLKPRGESLEYLNSNGDIREEKGGMGGDGKKPSVEDRTRYYIGRVHIYIAKTFLVPPEDLQRETTILATRYTLTCYYFTCKRYKPFRFAHNTDECGEIMFKERCMSVIFITDE